MQKEVYIKKKAYKSDKSDEIEDTFNVDDEHNDVSENMRNDVDQNGRAPLEKVVEKVIDATDYRGQLMFLLKLRGIEEWDLIVAKKAYLMCPQLVLKWYEERISQDDSN